VAPTVLDHPPAIPAAEPEEASEVQGADLDDAPESADEENSAEADEAAAAPEEESETSPEADEEAAAEETTVEEEEAPDASEDVAEGEETETASVEESAPRASLAEETRSRASEVRTPFFGTPSEFSSSRPETYLSDKSDPVFRTRVYRNEFSILTPVPEVQKSEIHKAVEEPAGAAENLSEPDEEIRNAASEAAEASNDDISEKVEESDDGEEYETSDEDDSASDEQGETDESNLQKRAYNRKKTLLSEEKVYGKESARKRK